MCVRKGTRRSGVERGWRRRADWKWAKGRYEGKGEKGKRPLEARQGSPQVPARSPLGPSPPALARLQTRPPHAVRPLSWGYFLFSGPTSFYAPHPAPQPLSLSTLPLPPRFSLVSGLALVLSAPSGRNGEGRLDGGGTADPRAAPLDTHGHARPGAPSWSGNSGGVGEGEASGPWARAAGRLSRAAAPLRSLYSH